MFCQPDVLLYIFLAFCSKTWFYIYMFFMYSRAVEGHASLLFAHKTDIRKIALDHHNSMVSIVNETRSSCAIDFNFRTGMIYWSDVMTQKIYKWVFPHNFLFFKNMWKRTKSLKLHTVNTLFLLSPIFFL